ncbi:MAG: thioredoxin fold domain-containing protein [Burkholderiaceae bacterium]|nr:thioredoxin fold domain-containing protein [Burkholderiaceae bacterium]
MAHVTRRRALLALAVAAPVSVFAETAADGHLQELDDLRLLSASIAQNKTPLLVLFSTPGCPFCREVRRNYLLPRVAEQARSTRPELILREADIGSQRMIVDLTGAKISEAVFASRYGVRMVPVVALFDQSLRVVGAPLVGLDRSGFYEAYLATAIADARRSLMKSS